MDYWDMLVMCRVHIILENQRLNKVLESSMRDYNLACMELQFERQRFLAINCEFLLL